MLIPGQAVVWMLVDFVVAILAVAVVAAVDLKAAGLVMDAVEAVG